MRFKLKKPEKTQSRIELLDASGTAQMRPTRRGPRFALRRLHVTRFVIRICAAVLLVGAWTAVIHLVRIEGVAAPSATSEPSRKLADTDEALVEQSLVTIDQMSRIIRYACAIKTGVTFAQLQSNAAAQMGTRGSLALLDIDGILRAKQADKHAFKGRTLSTTVSSSALQEGSESVAVNPWDPGKHLYTTISTLRGISLIIWIVLSSIALVLLAFVLGRFSWKLRVRRRQARWSQRTYHAVLEASTDALFVFRSERNRDGEIRDFVVLDANRRGMDIFGLSRDQLIGQPLTAMSPLVRANGMFEEFVSVVQTGDIREHEWSHEHTDGTTVWLHRKVVPVEDGVVAIMRDITLIKRADVRRIEYNRVLEMVATRTPLEEVLSYMARLLESQISGTLCAALLCDSDGRTLKLGAAPSLPQQYRDRMNGLRIGPDSGPSGRATHSRQPVFVAELALDEPFRVQMRSHGLKDVHGCWALPILSHDGGALGALTLYVCEARDPTANEALVLAMATRLCGIAIERTLAEERIGHLANHDALTGLPNRTLLSDRLNQVLLHAQRFQRGVTVISIDLDNFKLINDSLGHRSGDELLKAVASRMVGSARRTDTVVRLGGDEFVIVLFDEDQSGDGIPTVVDRIRNEVLRPLKLNGQTYRVTCSIGVASYPGEGSDADTLLLNANAAMCRAKEMGRNNYQIYAAEMNVKVHEKLRLQEDLRNALVNNELRLAYQPQVNLHTQQVFGVEALLRWHHPVDGLISPATFIPIAEDTGLILSIGDWVLHAACRQNKAWHEQGLPRITMSVNVSARQFLQNDLVARVAHALTESGLEPQYLELELTESVIMQDLESAVATMGRLQEMGVKLSVDDFGTGYSSLSALKHFPIVRLKIDQSFVRELPGGEHDQAIAIAVIQLGRQLNLRVIAEGVETEQQLAFLRENECNEIQGYHYSKPLYPAELEELLKRPFAWPGAAALETVP